MVEEKKKGKGDNSNSKGALYVIGIGPGGAGHLTGRAREAISSASCVVGYKRYVDLVRPLIDGKKVVTTGMTEEVERCRTAIGLAREGHAVCVVSSGDSGIYGMAGLILELSLKEKPGVDFTIEVVPGVPAFVSAASLLGAPLMHDFASISLSDLLTPWETIERRIDSAARADFVMVLYNPRSSKRKEGLTTALGVVARYRAGHTPCGIVRNATREGEEVKITTLKELGNHLDTIDMLSLIIIGNSSTFTNGKWMITPRGYRT